MGFVGPARAQHVAAPPEVSADLAAIPLPGGIRAAQAVLGDLARPDRGQFLLEVIRRLHQSPTPPNGVRLDALPALLAHLERAAGSAGTAVTPASSTSQTPETVPLPLTASLWIAHVFAGRATPETLAAAILRSRDASLFYVGLMSLDAPARRWIASRPDLMQDIATRRAAPFTLIAPALRITNGSVEVPGGLPAVPVWEELTGSPVSQPVDFVRGLLAQESAALPYMYGAIGSLTPAQIAFALNLGAADPEERLGTARRLLGVYQHVTGMWHVETRAFWRPPIDPALLVADLRADAAGRPLLPGTRHFWSVAFGGDGVIRDDKKLLAQGDPVELGWLCEQVYDGEPAHATRRHHQVLFASRLMAGLSPDRGRDAAEAVRAAYRYPALIELLERARLDDVRVYAAAARRASQLTDMEDDGHEMRALAQFQGSLMLLGRASQRGGLSRETFADMVTSISAIDLVNKLAYDGQLVRWLDERLRPAAGVRPELLDRDVDDGLLERALSDLISGIGLRSADASTAGGGLRSDVSQPHATSVMASAARVASPIVEWEGMRYRVDLAAAEQARLARVRGEEPRPYLSSARVLVAIADALGDRALTAERLRREAARFTRLAQIVGWVDGQLWTAGDLLERQRAIAAGLEHVAKNGDVAGAAHLAAGVRLLADDLLARGLTSFVYAIALGQPERLGFTADELAAQHDFGLRINGVRNRLGPWQPPITSADTRRDWAATGALFNLDVLLSPFSMVRLSSKLPPRRPTLPESDRRAFIQTVTLLYDTPLADDDRDAIVAALHKGRARVAALRTADDVTGAALALADEIGMIAARRTVFVWTAANDPERLAASLSSAELLTLGLERQPIDPRWHAWGVIADPRLGCLCLQLLERRPIEPLLGRWGTAMIVSTFPDLNLRMAEMLVEMHMPAALLGPVLTSATLEMVNGAASRDPDDRRALIEFVQALTIDRVEQYLALLTTDGPLVPVGKATAASAATGVSR